MQPKVRAALTLFVVAAIAFGAGYLYRNAQPIRVDMVRADRCMTNWDGGGTCMVGDWAYGIPVHVDWLDDQGGLHDGSDPACLPPLTEVKDLRVAVGVVYSGGWGTSHVFLVDCAGHPSLTPGTP